MIQIMSKEPNDIPSFDKYHINKKCCDKDCEYHECYCATERFFINKWKIL